VIRGLRATALLALTCLSACNRPPAGSAGQQSPPTQSAAQESPLIVYRFPFKAETLFPVTIETIVTRGARCTITDRGNIEQIVSMLNGAAAANGANAFTDREVRLLFLRDGKRLAAVERDGRMQMGGADRALTAEMTARLADLVKTSCQK
jgi:hypothetical protein